MTKTGTMPKQGDIVLITTKQPADTRIEKRYHSVGEQTNDLCRNKHRELSGSTPKPGPHRGSASTTHFRLVEQQEARI